MVNSLSFKLAKSLLFREFLSLANSIINKILSKFNNTVRRDLRHAINFYYLNIIKTLADTHSRIYLIINI